MGMSQWKVRRRAGEEIDVHFRGCRSCMRGEYCLRLEYTLSGQVSRILTNNQYAQWQTYMILTEQQKQSESHVLIKSWIQ